MTDFISEINGNVCELGSRALCLSLKERRKLVTKYLKITIDDDTISEYEFLPFLCSMLKQKNLPEIENCFRNPFYFFKEEFEKLYMEGDGGKLKYSALIICVLYNNKLTQNDFTTTTDQRGSMFRDVLKECKLQRKEHWQIQDALEDLKDVFIVLRDKTYMIIHDKLFDFIAKYFGEKMIDLFIKYADSDLFAERLCIASMNTSRNTADFIDVPDDRLFIFFERMVTDWNRRKVINVFCNINMDSVKFRRRFLSYLKDLDEVLQRELVQTKDHVTGCTPLLPICYYNDLEFADWILNFGADINLGTNDNTTPLYIACEEGFNELVTFLLTYRHHTRTALDLICDRQNVELNKLKAHSVDVNIQCKGEWTPLIVACYNNKIKSVIELLKCEEIYINHRDINGRTALYLACKMGNVRIVIELIRHSAAINISDKNKATPLFIACKYGHTGVVSVLLEYNADINIQTVGGWTPLMIACYKNYLNIVEKLLRSEQIDVDQAAIDGGTALYHACKRGNVEVVTELINYGVNINKYDNDGWSPLMKACSENHIYVVKQLLRCEKINIDHSNKNGLTALHVACLKGNKEIVTELIKHFVDIDRCKHIDINHQCRNGRTVFYEACHSGSLDIARIFIGHGVDINRSKETSSENQEECDHENKDKLEQFLRDRLNGDQKSDKSMLDFDIYSCQLVHYEIVREIARRPRTLFECKKDGWFPLSEACDENQIQIVKELLRNPDIKINQCNNYGQTALFVACLKSNEDVIAELIKNGVDVNISDINKLTPLHIACMARNKEVVKLLIENGAKVDLKDKEGKTPVVITYEEDYRDIVEILKENTNI